MRAFFTLAVLLLSAASAHAQYFGRNKVQYEHLDFEVLQTPHFDIYYYASEEAATRIAAELAERWYARLSITFGHEFTRRQPIILYASHAQFATTSVVPDVIGDGVGGFTDASAGRVVLPFAAGLGETNHVLGHELVHVFQRDILKERGRSLAMLPLWFSEGMAEYFSIGGSDVNTAMWLRDAALTRRLPSIEQLDDPRWFPYRYGEALWQYVADTYGEPAVVKALKSRAKGGIAGRLKDATGKSEKTLSDDWRAAVLRAAKEEQHEPAGAKLGSIVESHDGAGQMNVAPALSPDGRHLVFLSERDGLSIDVYLADARTGRVIRKLLNTATDPHFDSLQFIDSAGAWDSVGYRFVLATLAEGHPALTIFDMPSGDVRREIDVPGVDQIFNPTWSPDGRQIAFSAMKGGFTDLFTIDVATGQLHALTDDGYSDLQPAWSPDGRRLAFTTDRFSSSLPALTFGPYSLATIDVQTGSIALLGGYAATKNIDPQWSADGRTVYFVSDAGEVSNVHAIDVATGRMRRLTDVAGGVTGITALSPSISIGAHGKEAALSTYNRGAYEISVLNLDPAASEEAASDPADNARPLDAVASLLPSTLAPITWPGAIAGPRDAKVSQTSAGAPFSSRPYSPRLSLVQIGTPYLSAGGGAFGSFLRAGVSMSFGDMLGQQELGAAIQVGKQSTDDAIALTYDNRRSRWNWGVSAGRIPTLVGIAQSNRAAGSDAAGTVVQTTDSFEQVHRELTGTMSYPFSRARRIELSLGVDAMTFDDRATSSVYSPAGARLSQSTVTQPNFPAATIVQTGAALVYDTAIFGIASPILGQRYRFGLASSVGDVRVMTAVADYRRYVMPVRPFTLAFRAQGVARFGEGASDPRLLPLLWNMRDIVRGFETDNTTIRTSRYIAGNAELRFPLAGLFSRRASPALPMEGVAFADCGQFFTPALSGDPSVSQRLCSAGAGVRVNAAGFVFEFDGVRPVGIPNAGWRLGVNFIPGF